MYNIIRNVDKTVHLFKLEKKVSKSRGSSRTTFHLSSPFEGINCVKTTQVAALVCIHNSKLESSFIPSSRTCGGRASPYATFTYNT